ncbi:MAG: sigma-70 family RNA polymerase sigma factor [Verrucomicrobia bacterium]|nr:sigma-70 family RNA polymerase sigma factor [Verrucomicrobiota bacterium]
MRFDPSESEGGIKIYLREIGQTPLLTRQDEVVLAKLIRKGDKAARERMIKSNLRLVVKIAHDYAGLGLPLLDLISEGNIGLMKAVERFDPRKGGKLSTYGSWWIKQSMKRALANQAKTIRLPVHLVDKIGKMRRAALNLSEKLGRDPTDAELAEHLDMPVVKVVELRTVGIRPASLDAPIGEDDTTEFGEIVGDDDATSPSQMLQDKALRDDIRGLMTKLDDRERLILNQRFGLIGNNKEQTLEQIGARLGITRERVRQIQNIALRKLRKMMDKRDKPRKVT